MSARHVKLVDGGFMPFKRLAEIIWKTFKWKDTDQKFRSK